MGMLESGGIIEVTNDNEMPTFRNPGKPNARYDLIKSGGKGPQGQKQSRWTDAEGKPMRDKDYNHPGAHHKFPHYHDWDSGSRGKGYIINSKGEKEYNNKEIVNENK